VALPSPGTTPWPAKRKHSTCAGTGAPGGQGYSMKVSVNVAWSWRAPQGARRGAARPGGDQQQEARCQGERREGRQPVPPQSPHHSLFSSAPTSTGAGRAERVGLASRRWSARTTRLAAANPRIFLPPQAECKRGALGTAEPASARNAGDQRGRRVIAITPILLGELEQPYKRTTFRGDDERVFCHPKRGTWRRSSATSTWPALDFAEEAAKAERRMLGGLSTEPSTDLSESQDISPDLNPAEQAETSPA